MRIVSNWIGRDSRTCTQKRVQPAIRLTNVAGKVRMKKWMPAFLAVLSIACFIPAGLWAQAGATGAITGTVLDPKGGAISGATIIVSNLATDQKEREVLSTAAGTFNVPSLPPSSYSVEITAKGFSKFVVQSVLVRVTEIANVTATLAVGQVTETVTRSEERRVGKECRSRWSSA